MEFITPIPHSYPGNVVLTDDMGIIEKDPCPYGRPGQRFRITGRMKKAEVRGCGDILSAKLTFNANKLEAVVDDKNLDVQYFKGSLDGDNSEKQFQSLIDQLNAQNEWIRQQPVEALIGLIGQAAKKWLSDPKFSFLKDKGLYVDIIQYEEPNLSNSLQAEHIQTYCLFQSFQIHRLLGKLH